MSWSSAVIEVLFYIIFIGLFLQAVKKKEEFDEKISKVTAQNLKGLCCLAIFGHHYGQLSGEPIFSLFTHFGYLVLNIFLMISGYGGSYGLKNKENYLDGFLIRRCGKIVLCYWVMNGITLIIERAFYGKTIINSWERWVKIFLLRDASYTQSSWYIMMLFWLYIAFYLVARFEKKYLQFFMFFAVSGIIIYNIRRGMPLWYYNYLYSFNVGIYMANERRRGRKELFSLKIVCGFVMFALFFVISKINRIIVVSESLQIMLHISAILSSVALSMTVMFVMEKVKMESKLLCIIGGISTGVYVFHTCIMLRQDIQFKMLEYIKNWGVCFWISLGVTIVVSLGIKRLLGIKWSIYR